MGKVETAIESHTPITYSVTEDDGENLFLLSPLSGEFLLSRSLDFEEQRFYILTVAVQRGDLLVSSIRVYFNVLNVNDNPPVFSQDTFSASLLEDTQVGTCFLSLNVSDKDDGKCYGKGCGTQGYFVGRFFVVHLQFLPQVWDARPLMVMTKEQP